MKLVKSTKKHYIYELSEKELAEELTTSKYHLFIKDNYTEYKPTYKYDLGYADWEADTLTGALEFANNY